MINEQVAVVMVNYRTPSHVCEAIDSLHSERQVNLPNLELYVVDNHSEDDSVETIAAHIQHHRYNWVNLIEAERNGGYAYGNNLVLRQLQKSQCDYIWFLNPDTKLRVGAGLELISSLKDNSKIIVGSRLEDDDGTPQVSCFNFPNPANEFLATLELGFLQRLFKSKMVVQPIANQPVRCDWLAGASFAMSREVFDAIGLMDEEYFLYYEEVDYLLSAYRKGFYCWYVPSSKVMHAVGASTGISDQRKKAKRRPKYWFDSRRRYFLKNYGAGTLALADLGHMLGSLGLYIRAKLTEPSRLHNRPPHYLRDFFNNSFLIRGFKV